LLFATFALCVAVGIVLTSLHRRASVVPLVGAAIMVAILLAWLFVNN
jgi:hypothetical protein